MNCNRYPDCPPSTAGTLHGGPCPPYRGLGDASGKDHVEGNDLYPSGRWWGGGGGGGDGGGGTETTATVVSLVPYDLS